jgi:hypothetical protein
MLCCLQVLPYRPIGDSAEATITSSYGNELVTGFADLKAFYDADFMEFNKSFGFTMGSKKLYFTFTHDVYEVYTPLDVYVSKKQTGIIRYRF